MSKTSATGEKVTDAYQTICEVCNKNIQSKDPKQCEVCHNAFHTRCMSFRSVQLRGVPTLACATCVDSTSRARLDASLNATLKGSNTKKKPSSAPPSTTSSRNHSPVRPPNTATIGKDVTLRDIFEAIKEIREGQDEAAESLRVTVNKVSGLETRLGLLETRLNVLDDLPQLQARITNAEQTIAELRAQIEVLLSGPPPQQSTSNNNTLDNDAGNTVPSEIASLRRELLKIKQQQEINNNNNKSSREVVVSGLRYTRETSIDLLAYAVVSALDPTVPRRDIAGARVMGRLDETIDVRAPDSRLPPIAVTLSSDALARSTIRAKIRRGRLHTAELDASILEEARAPHHQGLINVNELLPPEIQKLRVRTWREVRRRPGCRFYIRGGRIYVRSTAAAEKATTISSEDDLADFLLRNPPATPPPSNSNPSTSNSNNNNINDNSSSH